MMVTICLQCGDVGYDNAYVYCVKCLKFAVHRYCLPEIPKTFDEFVDWVCDDCEAACSGSADKKALLNTKDGGRCTERVIFASTSGSKKKIISQSSPGKDESNGKTGLILQSVHENLGSSGDVRVTDDCYLSGAETNANTNWSQKESIPTKHEHQGDTSRQLDGVKEVKVATDESIQGTNLRKKTEVPSVVCNNEKKKLPSTSYQKIHYGERQSDTYRRPSEEDAEVASKFSEQTRFRKNSDISSSVPEKEKRRQTTSNHFNIPCQKNFDDAPARSSSLRNESKCSNSIRISGVEATKVVAEGSSQRPKLAVKSHISTSVNRKEMQMSTSSNQLQSRQPKQFGKDSLRYTSLHNQDRSRSLVNITKQRYNGRSSGQTHEARMPHNIVREGEKERLKEESLTVPARSYVNKEASRQTHEARRPVHNTVCQRDRPYLKEKAVIIPTRSNVNDERQIHEAKRPVDMTVHERGKEQVKQKSLIIPTRNNVIEEASRYPLTTSPIAGPSGNPSQVQPIVPIWRGRFDIVNKKYNTFEELVAHLSSRACQQVIEEARQLPALLPLEMVPKSAVWPKSFQTAKPTDDNIALYIFPADRRYEKEFDNLVEDLSTYKLAMRTTTNNAELLIFSSSELPTEYCRYKNKYYIWGVFKSK
ncbi:hypothetical protein Leryth_017328 [Lithospermum erythrorhizon]|nr:hypothetical protein Leryth_017328 [Lithospermum erythrorhizon]